TITVIYPLSLHDALPISRGNAFIRAQLLIKAPHHWFNTVAPVFPLHTANPNRRFISGSPLSFAPAASFSITHLVRIYPRSLQTRSEEHTSELQSRENLVC